MAEEDQVIPPGAMVLKIEHVDPATHSAPVIHFDGAETLIGNNQVVKFNLFQDRAVGKSGTDPKVPVERVICARLVMSPQVFRELADWLSKHRQEMFPVGGS